MTDDVEGIHTSPECRCLPEHTTCWQDASGMMRWRKDRPTAPKANDVGEIARERIAKLEATVATLVKWIEERHPEDFRSGLWDAINRSQP